MIIDRGRLEERMELLRYKSRNRSIGFTSGTFDLVHSTHVDVFRRAKQLCDVLIVGINSDKSVKEYKGSNRPIRDERDRITLIDGIKYIDYCFLFDEKNNAKNIEILKPDLYIKGGDYDKSKLSSTKLVEDYGGQVIILDTPTHISTSSIIKKIQEEPICLSQKHKYKGTVLLDRDGVINKEVGYLHKEKDFELVDGVVEAIKLLNKNNYAVTVVTNQPGIGVGLYTQDDFFKINKKMIREIHKTGAQIDKVYFCPDMRKDSEYKKPNDGMIKKAIEGILSEGDNWIIGDRLSDCLAGEKYCMSVGITEDGSFKDNWNNCIPDFKSKNLLDAVNNIILKEL